MRQVNTIASINDITLVGTIVSSPELIKSHIGPNLYSLYFSTQRLSNISDTVEIVVKESMLDRLFVGSQKLICGEIRTKNEFVESKGKNKLIIYVFAKDIIDVSDCEYNVNVAIIDGYICKTPLLRTTYSGKQICDLLIAVNGRYGKSYYLPAVAFNAIASHLSTKAVGDRVVVSGRLQSRQYIQDNKTYNVFELFISGVRGFNDGQEI